ncbi:hypothetical protein LSTR_LSTR010179 [Laodelphax striatellus]|uniref:Peptidase S8 pro-domain domain-containing protein n=1 Tax=Laodelphax striatellus TaxID=195883 RepID=A0A482XKY7_LAOST|nr:hypothetical protein LSTR_LSTR010179 [Laodelphax striatellus]
MSVGVGMGGVWGVAVLVLVGGCLQGGLARHYSSQWAAHIEGGPHTAQRIAQRHGFTFLGEIRSDPPGRQLRCQPYYFLLPYGKPRDSLVTSLFIGSFRTHVRDGGRRPTNPSLSY